MENWQVLGDRPTVLNPWCEESPMKHRATAVWYNSPWPWGFPKRERIPEMANHCHHSGWTQTKWRGPDCQGTARTGWSVKPGSQPGIIAPEWGRRSYSQVAAVVNQESNSSNTSEAGPTSSWKNQLSGRGQDEDEVSYSHWWLGMSQWQSKTEVKPGSHSAALGPSQWGLWPRTGMAVAELRTNMTYNSERAWGYRVELCQGVGGGLRWGWSGPLRSMSVLRALTLILGALCPPHHIKSIKSHTDVPAYG